MFRNKMKYSFIYLITLCLISISFANVINNEVEKSCNLNKDLQSEIHSYSSIVNKIIKAITEENYKSATYTHLATFIDKFGFRFTGTENLENAIDYMINKSQEFNLENVRYENVSIPHWVR